MEVSQLQRRYLEYAASLFHEGFLDSYFTEFQQLQNESNPNFVVEVVSLFFQDSQKRLNDFERALDQQNLDFEKVGDYVHEFKCSSSSIGAGRVRNACIAFRYSCEEQNTEGCMRCLLQVKQEYSLVKTKLEALLRLERQIVEAGGAVPRL